MKPTLEQLTQYSPEIDRRLAAEHLQRLPQRYFETFTAAAVCSHLLALSELRPPDTPVRLLVTPGQPGDVRIVVLAFDYPSVFSLITGVLAGCGFSIQAGCVFTYDPPAPYTAKQRAGVRGGGAGGQGARRDALYRRRRIVDAFSGRLPPSTDLGRWQHELTERLVRIFRLLEMGKPAALAEARARTNELVAARLEDVAPETRSRSALLPVRLHVDNSGRHTRLSVTADDTPAFLYALTNALALCSVSIEQVQIETHGRTVQDEIDIVDRRGRKIDDSDALNRIKLSVLLTKQFTYFLTNAPDPYAALSRFEHLVREVLRLPEKGQWLEMLSSPKILQDLARLLGASDFLWEDFVRLQYENLIPVLAPHVERRQFSTPANQLEVRLQAALARAVSPQDAKQCLNDFKDNEIFLIDLDHILNPEVDFRLLSERLTRLAETVVNTAAGLVFDVLAGRYGTPRTVGGLPAAYAIFGLGKMGGAALGYASDIELLVVYGDNGRTDGPEPVSNTEFFNRLVQDINQFITAKRDGIFNLDLRLRPYGNDGPLGVSLQSFCEYYGASGPAHSYERLALVRLRWIGGDPELGMRVERIRDELVYFSKSIRPGELRELRHRQFREKTRAENLNAKFSPGALVDLEYDVQLLQVMFGHEHPGLRTPRVHEALHGLAKSGVITQAESTRLITAYDFLRQLINGLRMLRGSAQDLFLPDVDAAEFDHLARRMGYSRTNTLSPAQQLRVDFDTCTAAVRAFVERHFGRESLPGPDIGNVADLVLSEAVPDRLRNRILTDAGFRQPQRAFANLKRLADGDELRTAFARLAVLACDMLRRNPDPDMALNNWEHFVAPLANRALHYELLLSQPRRLDILLSLFAGSQFLADTLVRHPQFLDWATRPENVRDPRAVQEMRAELHERACEAPDYAEWLNELRRYRRREVLRIGTRDICLRTATAETMQDLSSLAEAVTDCALARIWQELESRDSGAAAVASCFCVMAFGKLGGNELNYSSDIDLIGMFDPDSGGQAAHALCATVMEMLRSALSAHTAEGHAYRVDLRLRPYGRAGQLVTAAEPLADYYRNAAALWEIQALLKMRPVAGCREVGRRFLETVRPLLCLPRPAAEIADSIHRLRRAAIDKSRKQHRDNAIDVKNGAGGIRDVEFLAQGLQLMHAHQHPDVITGNTMEALDRLADFELLDSQEAAALKESYLFLRQVEHCLQIYDDRQVHAVPTGRPAVEALAKRVLGPDADADTFARRLSSCRETVGDLHARRLG